MRSRPVTASQILSFLSHRPLVAPRRIARTLSVCSAASKARMFAGAEPACLMDYWAASLADELQQAAAEGRPTPEHCSDDEIGQHVFDFLFAAQVSPHKAGSRQD